MREYQKIKNCDVKEDMVFSAPVFFDDGVNMFLAEKKKIKPYHLNVIKRWNIPFLLTFGHIMQEDELNAQTKVEDLEELDNLEEIEDLEELEELNDDVNNSITSEYSSDEQNKLSKTYNEIVEMMTTFFESVKSTEPDRNIIDNVTKTIYSFVTEDNCCAMSFLLNKELNKGQVASAINTAIIVAAMAIKLEYQQRKVMQIIGAALLHDIGMLFVPAAIINKSGKLTEEEFEQLKLHTTKASKLVVDKFMMPREMGNMIQQHHERWDGTGYPEGRKGEDIDMSARIISIADAFEAMVSEKSYRDSMIGYDAVKKLLDDNGKRFDPAILKVFIQIMGVYPVGSLVMLNDNSVARVVEGTVDSPFLPTVKILVAKGISSTCPKKNDILKLKSQRNLFIVRAVNPKEIENFA